MAKLELLDFLNDYPSEQSCIELLEKSRWNNSPYCPHCSNSKNSKSDNSYRCKNCGKSFSVKTGTIFEGSKVPLRLWFSVIYLATILEKGITASIVSEYTGITQKTAQSMMSKLKNRFESTSNYGTF